MRPRARARCSTIPRKQTIAAMRSAGLETYATGAHKNWPELALDPHGSGVMASNTVVIEVR